MKSMVWVILAILLIPASGGAYDEKEVTKKVMKKQIATYYYPPTEFVVACRDHCTQAIQTGQGTPSRRNPTLTAGGRLRWVESEKISGWRCECEWK